jgi:ribosome-associated translation inhibitor RaiA
MAGSLQISYRDVPHSGALEALIKDEAARLDRYFEKILGCRVVVEHAHKRAGAPFHARIVLNVPGEDIYINREDGELEGAFKDPALAIRSAFKKAKRQLQDYVRLRSAVP